MHYRLIFVTGLGLLLPSTRLMPAATAADTPTPAPAAAPADPKDDEAHKAWADLTRATRPPAQPKEWANRQPTPDERDVYRKKMAENAAAAADKALEFATRFPQHTNAAAALRFELQMLQTATAMGNTALNDRLRKLEDQRANDPAVDQTERARLRAQRIQREATNLSGGPEASANAIEKGARDLLKDFPTNAVPYQLLLSVANRREGEPARKLAEELSRNENAPDQVRKSAAALLRKMDAVGKPIAIQFTAVDGRQIDIANLKGKVVLLDFWATWCGPCVAELPNVKAAYEKLHPKGFEIVGISFDQKKDALTAFVEKNQMTWPQFFDGQGWKNKFGVEFGINAIPAMWLVDKKGILRDLSARGDLENKVGKLLAE
jgi:thiol-disulfide isomerase/thioredoxin